MRGVATTQPTVTVVSNSAAYGTDFAAASLASSNVTIDNLTIENRGNKTAQACYVSGKDCTVTNVRQVGVGKVLRFDGAQNLHGDLLYANTGSAAEYCIGAFGGSSGTLASINCHLDRFDIWCNVGVHGMRIEHSIGLVLGHETLRLPEISDQPGPNNRGFAFRAKYSNAAFGGTAIAVNDGSKPLIQRGLIQGMLSIGPLQIWAAPHPDWRMDSPEVRECDIQTLVVNLGTVNANIHDCKIGFVRLDGSSQGNPVYPPTSGTFTHCTIGNVPNNPNWKFIDCTYGNPGGNN